MYHQHIGEIVDMTKSYKWLERAGLKNGTEALTMAAQKQALSTRVIQAPDLPYQLRTFVQNMSWKPLGRSEHPSLR